MKICIRYWEPDSKDWHEKTADMPAAVESGTSTERSAWAWEQVPKAATAIVWEQAK